MKLKTKLDKSTEIPDNSLENQQKCITIVMKSVLLLVG